MRGQGVAAHHKQPLKEITCWIGHTVGSSEQLRNTQTNTCITPNQHHLREQTFALQTKRQLAIITSWHCNLIKNDIIQSSCYKEHSVAGVKCLHRYVSSGVFCGVFFGPLGVNEKEITTQRACTVTSSTNYVIYYTNIAALLFSVCSVLCNRIRGTIFPCSFRGHLISYTSRKCRLAAGPSMCRLYWALCHKDRQGSDLCNISQKLIPTTIKETKQKEVEGTKWQKDLQLIAVGHLEQIHLSYALGFMELLGVSLYGGLSV